MGELNGTDGENDTQTRENISSESLLEGEVSQLVNTDERVKRIRQRLDRAAERIQDLAEAVRILQEGGPGAKRILSSHEHREEAGE